MDQERVLAPVEVDLFLLYEEPDLTKYKISISSHENFQ